MKKILTEKDICPSCGQVFECSKSKRCWCFGYDIGSETLEAIEKKYDGCLCPECMIRFEGKGQHH